jgi:LPXTG-motif cell wall-anchored protein
MSKRLFGRLAGAAALGTAALVLAAPGAATAQDGPAVTTNPASVAPGGTVTISQFCSPPQENVSVTSTITGKLPMTIEDAPGTQGATYHATATIPAGTAPGSYELTGSCGGSGTLVVSPTGAPAGGTGLESNQTAFAVAGAGALAAAGAAGVLMLKRRRADAPFA